MTNNNDKTDDEIDTKVLALLYGCQFKGYFVGLTKEEIINNTGFEVNKINQVIESLEENFLIKYNDPERYIITSSGIDAHEYSLPLATQALKKQERRKIIEVLAKHYNIDTNKQINNQDLLSEVKLPQFEDSNYLIATVIYLRDNNLVCLDCYYGCQVFWIRLTIGGFESLKDKIIDNSVLMMYAYQLLFKVENYMRQFIEDKLVLFYHDRWWEDGMPLKIKTKVKNNKINESNAGSQISEVYSDMNYLYFEDIEDVISKNWDIFKTTLTG